MVAALACAGGGCAGGGLAHEQGAQCSDGKDNDHDRRVDCEDIDCAPTVLCRAGGDGSTARQDGRSTVADSTAPRSDGPQPVFDTRASPDTRPPPRTSYGDTCTYRGSVTTCADGKTVCVRSPFSASGFCTAPCAGPGSGCPTAPTGSHAECLYSFNRVHYCVFLCRYLGRSYSCPSKDFGCQLTSSSQGYCWPR